MSRRVFGRLPFSRSTGVGTAGSSWALFSVLAFQSPTKVHNLNLTAGNIVCSDFATVSRSSSRIYFSRELEGDPMCTDLERMSPGARVNFATNARFIRLQLDYSGAGANCMAFTAQVAAMRPAFWEFGLEVGGVPKETGTNNPIYQQGLWTDNVFRSGWITLGSTVQVREVSLIWPTGLAADLARLELGALENETYPELSVPAARPTILAGAFGDSITHGLHASHVNDTYPARLADAKNWSMVNLGFAGRQVVRTDAKLARGLTGLDLLILAIGSNDYRQPGVSPWQQTTELEFKAAYDGWLTDFRCESDVPILCITPISRSDEYNHCPSSRTPLESYRQWIRDVVSARNEPDIYLFEGRDLIPELEPGTCVPVRAQYFDYTDPAEVPIAGLHPNSTGFAAYASALGQLNLIRNPSFELKPLVVQCKPQLPTEASDPVAPYLWHVESGECVVDNVHLAGCRSLRILVSGQVSQDIPGLNDDDIYTLTVSGKTDFNFGGKLVLEFFNQDGDVIPGQVVIFSSTNWTTTTIQGTAPDGAVRGRVRLLKLSGSGYLYVDDLKLTIALPLS